MADNFDPDAWLKERQQQKKQAPPEAPKRDVDPDEWLRGRGTLNAASAAAPPIVMGAPDPVGKYRPGFIKGAEQAAVGSGLGLTSAAQAVRSIPYAGATIAQFPLTRPLAQIAKSITPEQRAAGEKFSKEAYTLPGQEFGYYAGKAAEFLPLGGVSEIRAGVDAATKIAATEGMWQAAEFLTHSVLPPGVFGGSAWVLFRLMKQFGYKPIMNFFKETKNLTADVKAIRAELAGAKGAGTFIPKAAETTGAKAAKTQAKFTPKESSGPKEPREPTRPPQTPYGPRMMEKIQKGEATSADIAAAKLAQKTGAYAPEDKEIIDALAKLPVKK